MIKWILTAVFGSPSKAPESPPDAQAFDMARKALVEEIDKFGTLVKSMQASPPTPSQGKKKKSTTRGKVKS